jgi:hypothetical protein
MLRSARAYLYATVRNAWEHVVQAGTNTAENHDHLILAGAHAAQLSIQIVDTLWTAAGTSSIYTGSTLDRCFRDVHVAGQNVAISSANYLGAGRSQLGMALRPADLPSE